MKRRVPGAEAAPPRRNAFNSGTPREREGRDAQAGAAARLAALARRAEAALVFERIWPPLAWAGALVALFLAASWFGLWFVVPRLGRVAGVAVFAALLFAALAPLAKLRRPTREETLARLDRNSHVPHRPAASWPIGSPPPATMRRPTRCGFSTDAGSPSKSNASRPPCPRRGWLGATRARYALAR